jgi:hypothetical protein
MSKRDGRKWKASVRINDFLIVTRCWTRKEARDLVKGYEAKGDVKLARVHRNGDLYFLSYFVKGEDYKWVYYTPLSIDDLECTNGYSLFLTKTKTEAKECVRSIKQIMKSKGIAIRSVDQALL